MKLEQKITKEYIAGFFDGEGCVSINMKGVRVSFNNTRLDILENIRDFFNCEFPEIKFGLGQIGKKLRKKNGEARTECYQLVYWDRHAEKVANIIMEDSIIKKEELSLVEKFMATRRLTLKRGRKNKLTNNILKDRSNIVELSHNLKFFKRTPLII